jgi:hypothetical protein
MNTNETPPQILNNTRFVPVQRTFRSRMSQFDYESWAIQDTSIDLPTDDKRKLITDEDGLVIIFYSHARAQDFADELLHDENHS